MSLIDQYSSDFIRKMVLEDIETGKNEGKVVTRFPPEPNGYLHIGHVKSASLNFGIASENGGVCHLRFDDTNPAKEGYEFVDAIQKDLRWLGFDWEEHIYYSSDYFERLYEYSIQLIKSGLAYVCELSAQEIRDYRGTLRRPGKDSPYRGRSVDVNLDLFKKMRSGEFSEGSRVLRAKIDMSSPNLNLRDPVIYRILDASHHRTGDRWFIYPTYDFAHGQSDSIEGITHSVCTMEFEDHRVLYDWFLDKLKIYHPRQIEFARLNISHTVLSKRTLNDLVECGHVSGWDDPRMPTVSGMRRRGYTSEAILSFIDNVGVAKRENTVEFALLEHCVRENLNKRALRVMAVLKPLKVVIDNYPEDQIEELDAVNNPEDLSMGSRKIPFSREIYIDQDDFLEDPPNKFFRLAPGREVRLRYGYLITCVRVVKDKITDEIIEVHCTYDPTTLGVNPKDGRRVKGTIHWVSGIDSVDAEVRLYSHLFSETKPDPEDIKNSLEKILNPDSIEILKSCRVERSLSSASKETPYQFERLGYFIVDSAESTDNCLVFNRTVSLRDTWSKINKTRR